MISAKDDQTPVIVITGCTASGKSSLAYEIASRLRYPIINADSKQVYNELSIGTDKPLPDRVIAPGHWVIGNVEHYLYGHVSIKDDYNVARYKGEVSTILNSITKPVLLVGGTGLYIDAVTLDYDLPADQERVISNSTDVSDLQAELGEDLHLLNPSDQKNPYRLQRMIVKGSQKGISLSTLRHIYLVVDLPKETIDHNIDERVDLMFEGGLLHEAEKYKEIILSQRGLDVIGYNEFREYFRGEATLDQVKELVKIHTRQYAKRQRTWFRRRKDAIYINGLEEATAHIENFLSNL